MANTSKLENIKKIKTALAEKYDRLSKVAKSKVKVLHFQNKSAEYRTQARRAEIQMTERP